MMSIRVPGEICTLCSLTYSGYLFLFPASLHHTLQEIQYWGSWNKSQDDNTNSPCIFSWMDSHTLLAAHFHFPNLFTVLVEFLQVLSSVCLRETNAHMLSISAGTCLFSTMYHLSLPLPAETRSLF